MPKNIYIYFKIITVLIYIYIYTATKFRREPTKKFNFAKPINFVAILCDYLQGMESDKNLTKCNG